MKRLSYGFCSYMYVATCCTLFASQPKPLKHSMNDLLPARLFSEVEAPSTIERSQSLTDLPDLDEQYGGIYDQVARQKRKQLKTKEYDPKLSKNKITDLIYHTKALELALQQEESTQAVLAQIATKKVCIDMLRTSQTAPQPQFAPTQKQ